MRQTTIFWATVVLTLTLNRPAFPAESAPQQAQLTVLCERRSDTHCDESFAGSTKWSTERLPVGADQKPQVVVRADVEIPSRGVAMKWLMYPNDDKTLPASHVVEIRLGLPPELLVADPIAAVFAANSALGIGDSLGTVSKTIDDRSFVVGLQPTAERNLKLIQEHCWVVVSVLHGFVHPRLDISMEKGKGGARAFADAFAAWGDTYTESSCVLSFAPPIERQPPHYRIVAETRAGLVDGVLGKR
jgi:hypothetical protein